MAQRYTHTLYLSLGGDEPTWEGEATVSFSVSPGCAETPPSYSHGGLPAEPATVEDVTVTHIDGEPISARTYGKYEADTLECHIECSDELMAELLQAAAEDEIAAHDDAMERRWEERRLEAF
ncbi:hypothetical protein LRS10_13600 [Phenylobacterium sp. J426]|uniref:hypothetical protein n=1 Tax=Phenylobacterium sp. J426 TaxID=2898439 RepID=UPI002151B33D|nr:hypothetical protein [Phenylobacterium sp. J426]MCR5875128.1 hypothetical protein [Phenylobacterium sp. J426]